MGRRLVSEPVGSDEFRVFEMDTADLSDYQLKLGMEGSKNFTGFFTVPAFRELCLTDSIPDHPMYRALPKEVYVPADEEKAKSTLAKLKAML